MTPGAAARSIYGENPFPESLEIARYIREHSPPTARIAVLGSEPQICFYARRRSATGYLYTYDLMESRNYARAMQEQMIAEIEQTRPEYMVAVNIVTSWTEWHAAERLIFTWAEDYVGRNYTLEGVVDLVSPDRTEYRWGDDAKQYRPLSKYRIQVFRRLVL